MMHIHQRTPAVSMLVLHVNGSFHKKATGITTFTCEEGDRIRDAVEKAIATGEGVTVDVTTKGWNDKANHAWLIKDYLEAIPLVAAAGYTNLICFAGNRNGMDDETGLQNCVEGLKQIMPLAEKHGVIIQIELFNSKIDHKDYMGDKSAWGIELCKRLGSPNFKILFDIYHMQIDEGDIIRSIQDNHQYFGHYHTAGVPGRHEIDERQELYYPAIMRAIAATGYKGYVAQEFIPKDKDAMASLKKAIQICDI